MNRINTDLKEKKYSLHEMITYQEGAVVSREIIRKDTGTVTLFAFDEGQELSEHTAPFDALIIVYEGKADVSISGVTHVMNDGDMLIIPSGKVHALKAISKFKMLLTMIRS